MAQLNIHCSCTNPILWQEPGIKLMAHDIDLWKIHISDHLQYLDEVVFLLNDAERNKADRFYLATDRQRFILSKGILKYLLGKYTGQKPQHIILEHGKNKKPYWPQSAICFNTAHSGKLILIAISNVAVGVDVEKIDKAFAYTDIVHRCFAEEEKMQIKSKNNHNDFYTIWSRKEAVVKVDGTGIADNMDALICLNGINTMQKNELVTDAHCFVTTFMPADDYMASIACHQNKKINYYNFLMTV